VANVGVMASQELPAPGKLRLRGTIASREADAEAQQFRSIQLSVVSRLKQAYFRLQHAWAMESVLSGGCDLLRQLLRVTEARYTVGKATQADVLKAQTQITLTEVRMVQFDREKHARMVEINSLLSRPPEAPLGEPGEPHRPALDFPLERLLEQAKTAAPLLARDQKMMERATAAVSLARKGLPARCDRQRRVTTWAPCPPCTCSGPMFACR
jgi:cobalt-zinc-cadmium efflux system outer membrane protein